jgi:RNA polymerase sigma-70 factor (ECF subfamily)
MTSELSDLRLEGLVAKAQADDRNACNQLIAQIDPWLKNAAAGLIQDQHLREDALQEMWIEVFKKLSSFRYSGEARFKSWLKKILRNQSLELLRNRRRRITSPLLSESDDGSVVTMEPADKRGLTPEQVALQQETIERVRKCVDLLPAEQREAILLYEDFKDRHSVEELCEQRKIPEGTLKYRLSKARNSLRECLAREDLDPQNPPSVSALDKSS